MYCMLCILLRCKWPIGPFAFNKLIDWRLLVFSSVAMGYNAAASPAPTSIRHCFDAWTATGWTAPGWPVRDLRWRRRVAGRPERLRQPEHATRLQRGSPGAVHHLRAASGHGQLAQTDHVAYLHGRQRTRTLAHLLRQVNPSISLQIRYDTRCCFNVRSKVDTSQINLPHGRNNWKVESRKK